jgi:hypothetical protein
MPAQNQRQQRPDPRRGTLALRRTIGQAVILEVAGQRVEVIIGNETRIDHETGGIAVQLVFVAAREVVIVRKELT